jgi:hypothetical protein
MSLVVPLSCIAEVREITFRARTAERSEMISSVRPSLKYSLSGSGLRLAKGSTTMERSVAGGVGCATAGVITVAIASAKARTLANRSAGSRARALAMAASHPAGVSARRDEQDGASWVKRLTRIA